MCGIAGVIGLGAEGHVRRMLGLMRHRGPDGEGFFSDDHLAMGMRRLAIIDLAGGDQPIFARGGKLVTFQNGEIYNHRYLRRQLEADGMRFRTRSDTEAIALGIERWGIHKFLEQADGMFAIAVYDRDARELWLARDACGEKPLYLASGEGWLAYGSDLVGMATLPWVTQNIDEMALDRYLAVHYVAGDRTILRDVQRVLPGEVIRVHIDSLKIERERWWRPKLSGDSVAPDLPSMLDEAVHSRLESDVPVGIFLSGGIDSALVAALAARHHPGISTFSIGFPGVEHDESPFAREVAAHIGSSHHEFKFDIDAFCDLLPKVANALDEPIGDQAALPLFWLAGEARNHVTVVLSGEGADEIFSGYGYYRDSLLRRTSWKQRLRGFLSPRARNAASGVGPVLHTRFVHNTHPVTPAGFPLLADAGDRERLTGRFMGESDAWERELMDWLGSARNPLQRAQAADIASWMVDNLLVKLDRMTMAHSIEGRAPFLARKVVDAGLGLSQERRISADGISKAALRALAGTILPQSISTRRKQGFVLPMGPWLVDWFRRMGPPKEWYGARAIEGLNAEACSQLTEQQIAIGVTRERLVFALVLLHEWSNCFFRKVSESRKLAAIS